MTSNNRWFSLVRVFCFDGDRIRLAYCTKKNRSESLKKTKGGVYLMFDKSHNRSLAALRDDGIQ